MNITIKRYVRKPFEVEAVQVTDRNFSDVVAWCEGEAKLDENHRRYIEVAVRKPINKRQTTAYVGDFVVLQRKEFKVFKNSSFRSTFDEVNNLIAEQLEQAGHLVSEHQLEFEEGKVSADAVREHVGAPKKQKHGQNGWTTTVTPTEQTKEQVVDQYFTEQGNVVPERQEVIPGYTYEEAMAAGRAGDGNVRQQLDALVMENEGIVYDWDAPAGHELDEAIRQGKAQPFDTDDAAVTVVQVDPEAALSISSVERDIPVGDQRNYPREVEEDRPIGI